MEIKLSKNINNHSIYKIKRSIRKKILITQKLKLSSITLFLFKKSKEIIRNKCITKNYIVEEKKTKITKEEGCNMNKNIKKVAILTGGGDAPGLNAVIRAIVKMGEKHNVEVYGYLDGFKGVFENNYIRLDSNDNAKGLLSIGGTILGTNNNLNLFRYPLKKEDGTIEYTDMTDYCVENIKKDGFDVIFTLGGDGTLKITRDFSTKGVNFIAIPKTIDNDVCHTDQTFGFDTAVSIATDALDKLKTTAFSHHRIMVLEVMGRYSGWIALHSGIAGAADAILIPEIPFEIEKVAQKILNKKEKGKNFAIVVVAEGATFKGEDLVIKTKGNEDNGVDNVKLGGIGNEVARRLEEATDMQARSTTLGYLQRGGEPSSFDRIFCTEYGCKAMSLALDGILNVLVTYKNGNMTYISLEDAVGKNKSLGAMSGHTTESNIRKVEKDNNLLKCAKELGISFGD